MVPIVRTIIFVQAVIRYLSYYGSEGFLLHVQLRNFKVGYSLSGCTLGEKTASARQSRFSQNLVHFHLAVLNLRQWLALAQSIIEIQELVRCVRVLFPVSFQLGERRLSLLVRLRVIILSKFCCAYLVHLPSVHTLPPEQFQCSAGHVSAVNHSR